MAIARLRRIRDKLRARTSQRDKRYYGLDGLDEKLERYIDWDGGVFVEAGALVPLAADNGSVAMTYCGLMSVVDGGWADPGAERAHVEAGLKVQAIERSYRVTVPGRSLSSLLDRHGFTRVDLLSLDVEGFERQALEGLDFSRHRPRFILVEARFRADIDSVLLPLYDVLAQLSHHDVP